MARYEHDRRWASHILNARTCADVHRVGFWRSADRMMHTNLARRKDQNEHVRDGYLRMYAYYHRDDRDRASPWEDERHWRVNTIRYYPGQHRNRYLRGCQRDLEPRTPIHRGWVDSDRRLEVPYW